MSDKEADEATALINEIVEKLSGHDIVEIGVGLAAKGLFRMSKTDGFDEAVNTADAVSSTFTGIHIDFRRAAAKAKAAA